MTALLAALLVWTWTTGDTTTHFVGEQKDVPPAYFAQAVQREVGEWRDYPKLTPIEIPEKTPALTGAQSRESEGR